MSRPLPLAHAGGQQHKSTVDPNVSVPISVWRIGSVATGPTTNGPQSTQIVVTAPSTANYGDSVTITATVSPGAGLATGTVDFQDGDIDLGARQPSIAAGLPP